MKNIQNKIPGILKSVSLFFAASIFIPATSYAFEICRDASRQYQDFNSAIITDNGNVTCKYDGFGQTFSYPDWFSNKKPIMNWQKDLDNNNLRCERWASECKLEAKTPDASAFNSCFQVTGVENELIFDHVILADNGRVTCYYSKKDHQNFFPSSKQYSNIKPTLNWNRRDNDWICSGPSSYCRFEGK